MVTTIRKPNKARRRKTKESARRKLPVPVDELPEYRDAVEWATGVRAEAEKKIARETSVIPIGVMQRCDELLGKGMSRRQLELIELWNGVGARGCRPGAGDFYALQHVLQNFALLPGIGEDVGAWWLHDSDGRGKERDERLNYYVLIEGHHKAYSESTVLLTEALRTALASLLPDIPSAPAVLGMLQAKRRELPEEERLQVTLSEITHLLNEMEWRRDRIESDSRERIGTRVSVEEVHEALTSEGLTDFLADCGHIDGAEVARNAIERFGARARGCVSCANWFAVDEDKVTYDWYNRCPGCAAGWTPHISMGGRYGRPAEEILVDEVRGRTEFTIDLGVKVALAEGTTVRHARQLLKGTTESPAAVKEKLRVCPIAGDCKSLCGALQAGGERDIPIAPEDGRYESCEIYAFRKMAEGIEGEVREDIAREWIRQTNEKARNAERKQASALDAEAEDTVALQADGDVADAPTVSVQASMF